jgi:hypothetical protein
MVAMKRTRLKYCMARKRYSAMRVQIWRTLYISRQYITISTVSLYEKDIHEYILLYNLIPDHPNSRWHHIRPLFMMPITSPTTEPRRWYKILLFLVTDAQLTARAMRTVRADLSRWHNSSVTMRLLRRNLYTKCCFLPTKCIKMYEVEKCNIRNFHGGDYEECRLLELGTTLAVTSNWSTLRRTTDYMIKVSSGMWQRVALVRTNVSGERIAFIARVKIITELGTTLAVTSNWSTLGRTTDWLYDKGVVWDVTTCGYCKTCITKV